MSKITVKTLEALTPVDDSKVLREDGGLVGKVRAGVRGVTVLFRYEFKLKGVKRDHRLGSWPKKSLATIRTERDRVRAVVADGISPEPLSKPNASTGRRRLSKPFARQSEIALRV